MEKKRKRNKDELGLYLHLTYIAMGERHYLSSCFISDNETETSLLQNYQKEKKRRMKTSRSGTRTSGWITGKFLASHSSVLKASFAEGAIEVGVLADQNA